jgi:hypothetical protein
MAERKTNRNAQTLKRGERFRISRKPVVHVAADEHRRAVGDRVGLPREYGARILFAIARDPRTIFASWNIDWPSLFEKIAPVDRQVHLRVIGADGLEEKTVAVEPMAMMHYLTTSRLHASYRVEIGYYQPADAWHSVAVSPEILMPPYAVAEAADVDLATIPFHVAFQQLLNLFRPINEIPLAVAISRFKKRVLSSDQRKQLTLEDKKILRELHASVAEIAAQWRAFNEIDGEKLGRRGRAFLGFGLTSPPRGFGGDWASAAREAVIR